MRGFRADLGCESFPPFLAGERSFTRRRPFDARKRGDDEALLHSVSLDFAGYEPKRRSLKP